MGRKASALGSGIVVWDEDRWCVGGFWVSLRWWVGVEGREAAAVHHSSSQVAHCGVGLQVKVSEHGPRVPAAMLVGEEGREVGRRRYQRVGGRPAEVGVVQGDGRGGAEVGVDIT